MQEYLQIDSGLSNDSDLKRGTAAIEKKHGRKERNGRKKEKGFVRAGLKPALWELAHRKICASCANLEL